ncbi:MAG: hypothetical protein V7K89_07900 [Nostoc sp.]
MNCTQIGQKLVSFLSVYSSLLAILVSCWDRQQKILIASWECDRVSL